jgi:hypothetical protein
VAPSSNPDEQREECKNCAKFGKDECWTHSLHLCGKCKKRGKTCLCAKQALYQARLAKKVKDTKETPDDQKETECQVLQRKFLENQAKEERALLELQRLKRMMDAKRATIERLVEERSDLKNHLEKVPIWADNHLTRLNWDRQQFESLISDLEARIDQLTETVRMQERQQIDCADGGVLSTNQLLLPRHLTSSVEAPEPSESDWDGICFAPSQNCQSMDGAQGAYPGGGMPNTTDYSTRQTDSSEGQDTQASLESMMTSMLDLAEEITAHQEEMPMAR